MFRYVQLYRICGRKVNQYFIDMFSYTDDVFVIIAIVFIGCVSIAPLTMDSDLILVNYFPLLLVFGVSAELFLWVTLPGVPDVSSLFLCLSFLDFFFSFSFSLSSFSFSFLSFSCSFFFRAFTRILLDIFF